MSQFTQRTHAPFRYDIVGSFLRPAALKQARADFAAHTLSADNLRETENECIRRLVDQEIAAGLQSVTDGEFRRSYWHLDFMWGFDGIEHNVMEQGYLFHGEETRRDSARAVGKIHFTGHPFLEHYRFLKKSNRKPGAHPPDNSGPPVSPSWCGVKMQLLLIRFILTVKTPAMIS